MNAGDSDDEGDAVIGAFEVPAEAVLSPRTARNKNKLTGNVLLHALAPFPISVDRFFDLTFFPPHAHASVRHAGSFPQNPAATLAEDNADVFGIGGAPLLSTQTIDAVLSRSQQIAALVIAANKVRFPGTVCS